MDAASAELHERNRGLPGVCERIRQANRLIRELRLKATASVTMSRLVDYEALPDFLGSLRFTSVVFSYPLTYLPPSSSSTGFLLYSELGFRNHSRSRRRNSYAKIARPIVTGKTLRLK